MERNLCENENEEAIMRQDRKMKRKRGRTSPMMLLKKEASFFLCLKNPHLPPFILIFEAHYYFNQHKQTRRE